MLHCITMCQIDDYYKVQNVCHNYKAQILSNRVVIDFGSNCQSTLEWVNKTAGGQLGN